MGRSAPVGQPDRTGRRHGVHSQLLPALGRAIWIIAGVIGLGLVAAALTAHYLRPLPLGQLAPPRPAALATYGACVLGELILIDLGSRALTAAGHGELRPALIATVVGLHFIPFAWAFSERMFYWLGGLVATLGVAGLLAGFAGVAHAAEAMAVTAGLAMQVLIVLYALGRFAHSDAPTGPS